MTILDRPPPEWKRPPIPCRVKLQVLINQGGKSAIGGVRLGRVDNTHFDHRPALWERKFDTAAWDTTPPANDDAHIEAITVEQHDRRTNGPGGEKRITTRGSDAGNRAKDRAIVRNEAEHRAALSAKASGLPRQQKGRKQKFPTRQFRSGRKFASEAQR